MLGFLINAALALAAISLLIIVHEFGHLVAAKAVGMKVETFSVGFWKKLYGFKMGETEYRVSLVPLGGYVKVAGESPEEGSGEPYEFWSKSPGQRALFIVGGVAMNFVLALVLFIVAFAIGVPFAVAQVGETVPGQAAWKAGLKPRDRIVRVGDTKSPVFKDITYEVALGGREQIPVVVEREGRELSFLLESEYSERAGLQLIGVAPPFQTRVTALNEIVLADGSKVRPARDAGIRLGDRILAINGRSVWSARDLQLELLDYPHEQVELRVRRADRVLTIRATTVPAPHWNIGISGVEAAVDELEGDGMAERLGLRPGDRFAAINGIPVGSWMEAELAFRRSLGRAELELARGGSRRSLEVSLPDRRRLEEFTSSFTRPRSNTLTWVGPDSPAWEAGLRPGDTIVRIDDTRISEWRDVAVASALAGREAREVTWRREGRQRTATIDPRADTQFSRGLLGVEMEEPIREPRRVRSPIAAVRAGLSNVMMSVAQVYLTVRGIASRTVSARHVGGIITIAYVSYSAAEQGLGKLLYITGALSTLLAAINILPIPVLDGGHLVFTAIEKLRGRRLSERVLTIAQTVGLVLLVALLLFALRNDIMRVLQLI